VFDQKQDDNILQQVLTNDQLASLERVYGDVADTKAVVDLALSVKPTAIIHLAGLQIPTCKANPILGATVNVIGTLNVFEAARILKEQQGTPPTVVYASSAAAAGQPADYGKEPLGDDTPHKPLTHYGVFKQTNEGNARVYWHDHQIPSVGLRPFTVYGVGREVGLTSAPTKAIKAAILGKPYTINFSGHVCLNYVEDVARIFLDCSRAKVTGAFGLNIKGDVASVEDWIKLIEAELPAAKGLITFSGGELPYPVHFLETGLEKLLATDRVPTTPLSEAIGRTVQQFLYLKNEGLLHARDL